MEPLLNTDACTLLTAERPLRLAEFDDLFATAVRRVERRDDTVRLHLEGDRGLGAEVRDLTAREAGCCSFFAFTIAGSDQDLTLDIAVPPAQRDILEALVVRAEELSA